MPLLHVNSLAATSSNPTASIIGWALGLLGLVIALFLSALWVKKRMSPTQEYQGGGFTLADLRDLRKSGAMSEEEYERAKAKLVQSLQTAAARKDAPAGPKIPPGNVK